MNLASRALITWDAPVGLLEPLETAGVAVERYRGDGSIPSLIAAVRDKDALLVHSPLPITRDVIAAAPRLRVVATITAGYENIDVDALRERGIAAGNAAGVVVEATADLTFALILGVMRRVFAGERHVRRDRWPAGADVLGVDLAGKTLGIFGMGAIGLATARRARVSGMRIAYTNRRPRTDADDAQFLPFDELLAVAHTLCILAPLTPQTRGRIDAAALGRMRPGAFLVNAARGAIVDTEALYAALARGHLAGAAVDVLEPEPIAANHPLLQLDTFFITPHIGTATPETRTAMARLAIANALAGLRGEPLPSPIPIDARGPLHV